MEHEEYINIVVPRELKKKLKIYAANHETNIKQVVIEALERFLKDKK